MTDIYLSGIEGSLDEMELMFESGYKLTHLMTAFPSFRKNENFITKLKEMKEKYGFKLIVDSGAYGFVFGKQIEKGESHKGWHDVASFVQEFKGREDDYFQEYFKWLKENKGFYDYAVELDIQSVIGQEQVDKWREQLLGSGLPIIYVLHLNSGDTIETVKKLKEKGVTYFGIGEVKLEFNKVIQVARAIKNMGLKLHLFGYTPKDLFKHKAYITSVDSSTWLGGSKLANLFDVKGKSLVENKITSDKLIAKNTLRNSFFDIFGRDKVESEIKKNKFWYYNFWNAWAFQRWANANNGTNAGYRQDLIAAEEGKVVLPSWVNELDKNGMPKAKYLRSRFNNYRSGVYARGIQQMSVFCDQCPVGGQSVTGQPLCPKYESHGLCFFQPYWSKLGRNTRNKEQIVRTLEDLFAGTYERYMMAKWTEQLTGVADKNVTALYKELVTSLELLNRVKFGVQNLSTVNMLNIGENKIQINQTDEDTLKKVREFYGEKLEQKIRKKIEKDLLGTKEVEAEVINDTEKSN